ncbi:hypothetical protein HHE06_13880 [Helicobacter heilmannii]|uniref:Uncharacterized protein n=1 Tax=Helicobacter heilmannii TaxID=35817 RepID=A0A0K2XDE4_HELHE|nr:hypothetical protein BN341_3800 [Helicobacter heilmannii ASB1.4]CRF45305.1 hypothetical protein HHE014_02660 [Helicobacter heilmannii]CRF49011.1 hypothetical protein HHE03_06070 [Helicobacter heilmannii]CRF51504.1 hypothetical protein HHE06_13880 [Helicobacter heilmannii]CRI34123.1 hypothetical protein HHE01_09690 [Helicobacter heilmannii]
MDQIAGFLNRPFCQPSLTPLTFKACSLSPSALANECVLGLG